jgi:hypothetical protein
MIIPTKCVAGHYARSANEGDASLGARVCSGIPLAMECSEGVSTSSSLVDGPRTKLNLNVDGRSAITSVLSR